MQGGREGERGGTGREGGRERERKGGGRRTEKERAIERGVCGGREGVRERLICDSIISFSINYNPP